MGEEGFCNGAYYGVHARGGTASAKNDDSVFHDNIDLIFGFYGFIMQIYLNSVKKHLFACEIPGWDRNLLDTTAGTGGIGRYLQTHDGVIGREIGCNQHRLPAV